MMLLMKKMRIIKKTECSKIHIALIRLSAIILAFVLFAIFLLALGKNPFDVYSGMIKGAFGSPYRFREVINKTVPLAITSLGILTAFKMKFWNIGAEGQIMMGAFASSYFALFYSHLPKPLLLSLMFLASLAGGGIWALIPAFFKTKFDTNETLFTLMMNYIALKWITYLQFGPWKDPKAIGFPKIANFKDNAIIPKVFGVNAGWILMLVLCAVMYIFIYKTKKGYEITVIGESENTARYAGMNVAKIVMMSLFISGGLCGITGMILSSGIDNTLSVQVSGGVGYTAIITTWLSQLSPLLVLAVSFLFGILLQGSSYIQSAFEIPQAAAQVLLGMILFFVLGSEFFTQYSLKLEKFKTKKVNEDNKGGAKI